MATPHRAAPLVDVLPSLRFVRSGGGGVRAFHEGKEYSGSSRKGVEISQKSPIGHFVSLDELYISDHGGTGCAV